MKRKTKNSKGPIINVRYESDKQVDRIKAAASRCHWSLNTFVVEAAEHLADEILNGNRSKRDSTNLMLRQLIRHLDRRT